MKTHLGTSRIHSRIAVYIVSALTLTATDVIYLFSSSGASWALDKSLYLDGVFMIIKGCAFMLKKDE